MMPNKNMWEHIGDILIYGDIVPQDQPRSSHETKYKALQSAVKFWG